MSEKFASAGLTMGQMNAIVKKLGGEERALQFLRGELMVSEPTRNWREKNDVIYFSVTSDGTTGWQWIERLEAKGFSIGEDTKSVLRNEVFKPTNGVTTEVAVLKGTLFVDNDRTTKKIRMKAANRKLQIPNAEIACLIREKFTDEEIKAMGLTWVVVMHEPIAHYQTTMLLVSHCANDESWLDAVTNMSEGGFGCMGGFAFAVCNSTINSSF